MEWIHCSVPVFYVQFPTHFFCFVQVTHPVLKLYCPRSLPCWKKWYYRYLLRKNVQVKFRVTYENLVCKHRHCAPDCRQQNSSVNTCVKFNFVCGGLPTFNQAKIVCHWSNAHFQPCKIPALSVYATFWFAQVWTQGEACHSRLGYAGLMVGVTFWSHVGDPHPYSRLPHPTTFNHQGWDTCTAYVRTARPRLWFALIFHAILFQQNLLWALNCSNVYTRIALIAARASEMSLTRT